MTPLDMDWHMEYKTALTKALMKVAAAASCLRRPLDTELPDVPVPDPGDWEICRYVGWPYRDDYDWYTAYRVDTWPRYVYKKQKAESLAERIMERENRVPSRILQVIRKLEELRDHLIRLSQEREQAARAILESPEEQEALAAILDRAALLKLRKEKP